jgi:hypothetical protein
MTSSLSLLVRSLPAWPYRTLASLFSVAPRGRMHLQTRTTVDLAVQILRARWSKPSKAASTRCLFAWHGKCLWTRYFKRWPPVMFWKARGKIIRSAEAERDCVVQQDYLAAATLGHLFGRERIGC